MVSNKILFPVFLCFGIIIAVYAGKFDALYRAGLRQVTAHNYDAALVKFKAALDCAELSQEEVKILFTIANVYSRQKKYKDAKNWLQRIFDIPDLQHKDKVKAYLRLINCSISLKRYDDALEDTDMVLRNMETAEDKAAFLEQRARIFELQENYPKAVEVLQNCIKTCKKGSYKWQTAQRQLMAILYKQKAYKRILELVAQFKLDEWEISTRRVVCYYAGLCASRQGNYSLAVTWFEQMPDNGPAWQVYSKNSQLGDCWKRLGKYDKAYKCFELIYKNTELHDYYRANSLWMMADLRYLQKKYQDSGKLCEKLIAFPKASKSLVERAKSLIALMKKNGLLK